MPFLANHCIVDGPTGPRVFAFGFPRNPFLAASLPVNHAQGEQWQTHSAPYLGKFLMDFGRRVGAVDDTGQYFW